MQKSFFFVLPEKEKYLTNGPFTRQLRQSGWVCYHKLRSLRDEWSHRESLSFSSLPFYLSGSASPRPYTQSTEPMSARCGKLRRQSLFIDRCVHSRSVQKWPLRETVEHISYREHMHAAVTSLRYFFFFFTTKIASHSFPIPRIESGSPVYLNATSSNVRACWYPDDQTRSPRFHG